MIGNLEGATTHDAVIDHIDMSVSSTTRGAANEVSMSRKRFRSILQLAMRRAVEIEREEIGQRADESRRGRMKRIGRHGINVFLLLVVALGLSGLINILNNPGLGTSHGPGSIDLFLNLAPLFVAVYAAFLLNRRLQSRNPVK